MTIEERKCYVVKCDGCGEYLSDDGLYHYEQDDLAHLKEELENWDIAVIGDLVTGTHFHRDCVPNCICGHSFEWNHSSDDDVCEADEADELEGDKWHICVGYVSDQKG